MAKAEIMIVEDDGITALYIQKMLESLGYTSRHIEQSGERAIQKLSEYKPDLVLMDIKLHGDMDGISAAEEIRTKFDIPVVYLTAHADDLMLERVKNTEPYGYILKPFEDRELHLTIEMALHKHRLQSRLKENERWLSTVLMSIGDAIIATDSDYNIVFMNPVAVHLTGHSQERALGRNINEVFKLDGDDNAVEHFRSANECSLKVDMKDRVILKKTGSKLYINGCISPILDDNGSVEGIVIAFHDITEKKLYEETLKNQRESFISVLLHDLKSPVIAIKGYLNRYLVGKAKTDKEKEEVIRIAHDASGDVLNIIEDISQALRSRNSMIAFNPHEVKFNDVLASVLINFMPEIEKRGIELIVNEYPGIVMLEETSVSIMADLYQIKTMTENLIGNAIKYANRLIEIKLQKTGDNVILSVVDDGKGIEYEYHEKIFEEYFQAPESVKGTGLGLYSVKKVVEKHRGTISLKPIENRGAHFEVILPFIK
ncbi:MAG: response regulator [Nitrospirae bacterium]|nr:response regulator [Nitrospirota bacterium]